MSNRVRVLFIHPEHGPYIGRHALQFVEQRFEAANQKRIIKFILPEGFTKWPRWKRAFWMTKRLGANWKMQIFREPRRIKSAKSVFWRAAEAIGFSRPKRKPKVQPKKKELKPKNRNPLIGNVGMEFMDIRWDAQPIQPGQIVNPAPLAPEVPEQARRQRNLNEIYDELLRNGVAQLRGRLGVEEAFPDPPRVWADEAPEPEER